MAPTRFEIGIGGLTDNLYLRAERMADMGGIELPERYRARVAATGVDPRTLDAPTFLDYARRHPWLYLRTAVSDAVNLVSNPGVAMLAGRYLGLFDLGERGYRDLNKWRATREKEGYLGLARLLWRTSPMGFVLNGLGLVLRGAFLAAAVIGARRLCADHVVPLALRVLVLGVPAYLALFTSLTAGYTRWDHRSPMEFALALLFAIGLASIARRFRRL